jgi:hypothetical protein
MIEFESGCTPNYDLTVDFDENPNGLPILWLNVSKKNIKHIIDVPLNKEAVSKLLVELANRIGEM